VVMTASLRRLVECVDGRRVPLNSSQRSEMPGNYPYWGANGVVDSIGVYLFDEELVLLGEDGAPFDDPLKAVAFHVSERVWINNHIHVLRPNASIDPRFLTYALNVVDWMPLVSGSTRLKLTQDDMMSARVPVYPLRTQEAIADYLDAETSRINTIISKKRRISDLFESRLIAHAEDIIKGRSSNRATGIPSLSGIPASWQVLRNKVFIRETNHRSIDGNDEMLSVSHITGVTPRSEKMVYMFEAESTVGYKLVRPGDLVINTMWAWMGAAGVSDMHGIVSPAYGVYEFDNSIMLPKFYDVLVRTPAYIAEMTRFSRGVTSSRLRLYPDEFLRLSSPVPPIKTQKAIIERHASHESTTSQARKCIARQIQLLLERRQALITAVMTGEMSVPKTAA